MRKTAQCRYGTAIDRYLQENEMVSQYHCTQEDSKQTWTADSCRLAFGVTSVEAIGVPFSKHSLSNALTDFSNPRYFRYCNKRKLHSGAQKYQTQKFCEAIKH